MQLGPWLGKPEPLKNGVGASKDLGSLAPPVPSRLAEVTQTS